MDSGIEKFAILLMKKREKSEKNTTAEYNSLY